jgi:hypothetical protein
VAVTIRIKTIPAHTNSWPGDVDTSASDPKLSGLTFIYAWNTTSNREMALRLSHLLQIWRTSLDKLQLYES